MTSSRALACQEPESEPVAQRDLRVERAAAAQTAAGRER